MVNGRKVFVNTPNHQVTHQERSMLLDYPRHVLLFVAPSPSKFLKREIKKVWATMAIWPIARLISIKKATANSSTIEPKSS